MNAMAAKEKGLFLTGPLKDVSFLHNQSPKKPPPDEPRRRFKRFSITLKMLVITFGVGAAVWSLMDFFQTKQVKTILETQLREILESQSEEDRKHFDSNIRALRNFSKMIVSSAKFNNHFNKAQFSRKNGAPAIYSRTAPEWMLGSSTARIFIPASYYMILDQTGEAIEIYQDSPKPIPSSLARPTNLLRQLSHNQSYMTKIEGEPFVVTAETFSVAENETGTLLLATVIMF